MHGVMLALAALVCLTGALVSAHRDAGPHPSVEASDAERVAVVIFQVLPAA